MHWNMQPWEPSHQSCIAWPLQVVHKLAQESEKKKHPPSKEEIKHEIQQEHEVLMDEKDALESARKQLEHAKMEQVTASAPSSTHPHNLESCNFSSNVPLSCAT